MEVTRTHVQRPSDATENNAKITLRLLTYEAQIFWQRKRGQKVRHTSLDQNMDVCYIFNVIFENVLLRLLTDIWIQKARVYRLFVFISYSYIFLKIILLVLTLPRSGYSKLSFWMEWLWVDSWFWNKCRTMTNYVELNVENKHNKHNKHTFQYHANPAQCIKGNLTLNWP